MVATWRGGVRGTVEAALARAGGRSPISSSNDTQVAVDQRWAEVNVSPTLWSPSVLFCFVQVVLSECLVAVCL